MPHAIPTKRRALIIGAGASGLAAIQQALEAGLEPVCFEARSSVGGIWQFDEKAGPRAEVSFDSEGSARLGVPGEGQVGVPPAPNPVYNGLRTNVSRGLPRRAHAGFDRSQLTTLPATDADTAHAIPRWSHVPSFRRKLCGLDVEGSPGERS